MHKMGKYIQKMLNYEHLANLNPNQGHIVKPWKPLL